MCEVKEKGVVPLRLDNLTKITQLLSTAVTKSEINRLPVYLLTFLASKVSL